MTENLDHEDRKEKARDGIKSAAKAAWAKFRNRHAASALQTAIKAVVAASVAGGLVVSGVAYNNLTSKSDGSSKSISALQAQNAKVEKDLPGIHADITAAQKTADETKQTTEGLATDVGTVSAKNNENSQRISDVSGRVEQDSKDNNAKIDAVRADMAAGKMDSAQTKQDAKQALDQAAANQAALADEGVKVDGVATQVTDLAIKEQATAKAAGTAQTTADDAVVRAQSASASAASARAAADAAQTTANEALAKANEAFLYFPVVLSITATENQNASLTAPYGQTYTFGTADFDGTSKYLFSYTWLLSGFATSCSGGVKVDGSGTDTQEKPYPIITPSTAIDDYQSVNTAFRTGLAVPPAGTHTITFVINSGGNCNYSDIILTITKVKP